jgi:hypothetical protein
VKADGKQNNPPAGNSGLNMKKKEEWSCSVPIGSSVVQNDTNEPIGDKNRSRLSLKRAVFWSRKRLGKM